ncbi:hypothetical protein [Paenibacillus ihumii]|uniref:hypothetical protein n=1 Tax=Paenibacillus ihumii TaxID=687436 RepID=UPI0006D79B2E|nr:hypothetical protein [Paenibacillus ihumii]
MFKKNKRKKLLDSQKSSANQLDTKPTLDHTLMEFAECADLTTRTYPEIKVDLVFFEHLVDDSKINNDVFIPLAEANQENITRILSQSQYKPAKDSRFDQGYLIG